MGKHAITDHFFAETQNFAYFKSVRVHNPVKKYTELIECLLPS